MPPLDELPRAPESILELAAAEADELLATLEERVPRREPWVTIGPPGSRSAVVFGDSHGDWRSVQEVVTRFETSPERPALVGLGDYIDRAPPDCPHGSVVNALFLLSTAARLPDRVFLLQGNHELALRIGVLPHSLPAELEELWGPNPERYRRLLGLFGRGPIAAQTTSGAYFAHAGFSRATSGDGEAAVVRPETEETLLDLTWSECDASQVRRGATAPWGRAELDRFLGRTGLSVMLRGHDPDIAGRPLYDGRCLTLHTTRLYERFGGVLIATVPLVGRVRSVADLSVEHLRVERETFGGSVPVRPTGA